jgi:2-alkyl-3-oxoalkanoate reductase
MRVLVTGATGFLGHEIVGQLLGQNHDVVAHGRDFSGVKWADSVNISKFDTRDTKAVTKACFGVEAVIHCAALSSPWGHWDDFYSINVAGTKNVYAACLKQAVSHCVHISTPAVVFTGTDCNQLSDYAPYPSRFTSDYARSKKLAEDVMLRLPNSIILRPKAIYGAGDSSLLPRLVAAAKARRLPQIGNGTNLVSLTHVSDVANACIQALHATPDPNFPIYTIAGEPVNLWNCIREVLNRLGISSSLPVISLRTAFLLAQCLEFGAKFTNQEPRLTKYTVQILARNQTYDTSRALRDLGWSPRVAFKDGLEDALKDFL